MTYPCEFCRGDSDGWVATQVVTITVGSNRYGRAVGAQVLMYDACAGHGRLLDDLARHPDLTVDVSALIVEDRTP
jgi:hypothetical protein